MNNIQLNDYAVLPLRDIVIFPGMVIPLFVGRAKSIKAIEEASNEDKELIFVTQKEAFQDEPEEDDIYSTGVIGKIMQVLKLPDNSIKILVESKERVAVSNFHHVDGVFRATAMSINDLITDSSEEKAYSRTLIKSFEKYVECNKLINSDIFTAVKNISNPSRLVDNIASHLTIPVKEKQKILEIYDITTRVEHVLFTLENEIEVFNTEVKIKNRVKKQMEETQKNYYLNEQMKAIQKEIHEGSDSEKSEYDELNDRINNVKLSLEAKNKLQAEMKKLKMMNPISSEASIVRNYIETVLALPWGKKSKLESNLDKAIAVLDNDHYGLEKVKERIIESLAVSQRQKKMKGSIICLVGPPGVGKTSLAKSIAEATGRKFAKFSLGGMRDESEIRGHRKTYVGAMPGKILQLMKKVQYNNPVMLLDEIDKLGSDYRGDPAFALLEVLDPEQNNKFLDHYLEVEYDLSDTMFIATANSLDIPRPLLDRMEIIKLSGYTEAEKIEIAAKYLVEKLKKSHGLKKNELIIEKEVLVDIVRYYTREAGVRSLEKEIAKICRKVTREIVQKKEQSIIVSSSNVEKYLGVKKYDFGKVEETNLLGVTNGLAYTEVGGELLCLEAVSLSGKGDIKLTGKLGDVMQESAQTAYSFFKSQSTKYGIAAEDYQKRDIHLHAPEGAVPKDGPSAGIAMFTSIISAFTNIPVKKSVAMTGEITLRGRVLPIGGLKEKLLAAQRGGISTVIIPQKNAKDLSEIAEYIKSSLEIIPVEHADQVLEIALERTPVI
jgi:ATP-dependent Lon protease